MNDDKRLIFYIDAYSPDTIPMAKLAEYMADFAALRCAALRCAALRCSARIMLSIFRGFKAGAPR
jgi:hypothetical protein